MSIFLVLFIVCMLLWFITAIPNQTVTAPFSPFSNLAAFLSVLFLFLLVHGAHG